MAAAVAALVLVVGGPFVYINFIKDDAPAPLTFDDLESGNETGDDTGDDTGDGTGDGTTTSDPVGTTTSLTTEAGLDGTWTVSEGSQAGYRTQETLFGQPTEAAGRTTDVTGQLVIAGTTVEEVEMTVNMSSVASDEEKRDRQFRGRVMEVETYPESTFSLTTPIALGSLPTEGEDVTVSATGDFTIRGITKSLTFELTARLAEDEIQVQASVPVKWSDFEIPEPSFGPAQVEDGGVVEFVLAFTKSA